MRVYMADGVKKQGNSLEAQTRQLNNLTEAFSRMSSKIDSNNEQLNKFDRQMNKFRDYKMMVDEFNRSINSIRGTNANTRALGNNGDLTNGLNNRALTNVQRDSRVIEGTFRDLTRNVIKETDKLNREASSKWANLSSIILAPLTKNSELMRVGSSVVNNARTSFGNFKDFQRYRELASVVNAGSGVTSVAGASGASGAGAGMAGMSSAAGMAGLSSIALAAVAGVAAVVSILYGLGKAAQYANEKTVQIAQSLTSMGEALDKSSQAALNTKNNQIALSNAWENTLYNLTSILESALNGWLKLAASIASVTGVSTEESEAKQLNTRADISAQAQLSGFNLGSANKLASDTYDLANKFNEKFGVGVSELSKSLSDAWLNGSNAAAKYGVVVDDLTLKGYMASKGIDIANVEISDAMKQYYRYQLMEEELSAGSKEAMSQNIKGWKEYGMVIDKTKQKLFSFDEVIQLSAFDPTIPDLGSKEFNEISNNKEVGDDGGSNKNKAVNIIVDTGDGPEKLAGLSAQLASLPETVPVEVKVNNLIMAEAAGVEADARALGERAGRAYKLGLRGVVEPERREEAKALEPYFISAMQESMEQAKSTAKKSSNKALEPYFVSAMQESMEQAASVARGSEKGLTVSRDLVDYVSKNTTYAKGYVTEDEIGRSSAFNNRSFDTIGLLSDIDTNMKALLTLFGITTAAFAGMSMGGMSVPHFATGGIGTKESLITAFENDKAEAVIPLESQAGVDYLANAMREAGGMAGANNNIEVNLNVGMMVADNEEQIDRLTRMISDKLGQLMEDRGSLDYGSF